MNSALPEQKINFKLKQAEFSAYIRDPENNPIPGDVSATRMHMYRELFFSNINGFLSSNFPVLHQIITPEHWTNIAQDFFNTHTCTSPHFSEIPEEFIHYLQQERTPDPKDPPFMLELAHYEWVEMALSIAQHEAPEIDIALSQTIETHGLALSTLAWPLLYQYPVHQISPEFLPDSAPEQVTCLIAYRQPDFELLFMEISSMTYRLLQIIQEQPGNKAEQYLTQLLTETAYPKPEIIRKSGLDILCGLAEKGIIYRADANI